MIAAVVLVLASCGPAPFDAESPYQPLRPQEGRAYQQGYLASAPTTTFDEFADDRARGQGPDAPATVLPNPARENPWATDPQNPVVTVCYSSVLNSAESVRATAQRLCPDGARLELLRQDAFLNSCPLIQPTRAAYRCRTEDGDAAASQASGPGGDAGK
jgi:hypothetical protein